MSPESLNAKAVEIRGQYYSAVETYGDAIGVMVEAATPQAAKEQFQALYESMKAALKILADRFDDP
jgi:hypothetical protein